MSDVNRKIAELLGWIGIHTDSWYWEGYQGGAPAEGLVGVSPELDELDVLPDYEHDPDETIKAAFEWIENPDHLKV